MTTVHEITKKHGRIILLMFSCIITAFEWIAPPFCSAEVSEIIVKGRSEWMILFTMIVTFYFKNRETGDDSAS